MVGLSALPEYGGAEPGTVSHSTNARLADAVMEGRHFAETGVYGVPVVWLGCMVYMVYMGLGAARIDTLPRWKGDPGRRGEGREEVKEGGRDMCLKRREGRMAAGGSPSKIGRRA